MGQTVVELGLAHTIRPSRTPLLGKATSTHAECAAHPLYSLASLRADGVACKKSRCTDNHPSIDMAILISKYEYLPVYTILLDLQRSFARIID